MRTRILIRMVTAVITAAVLLVAYAVGYVHGDQHGFDHGFERGRSAVFESILKHYPATDAAALECARVAVGLE